MIAGRVLLAWLTLARCHPGEGSPRGGGQPPLPVAPTQATQATPPAATIAPPRPEAPRGPVRTPRADQAHAVTQQRLHGKPLPDDPRVAFTMLEDPSGAALDAFHTALRNLEHARSTEPVRVALYGSSSVAIDVYPAYLRSYLQTRFGDAGVGFVAIVPLWRWHRHDAVQVTASKHWTIEHAQRKVGKLDGDYGLIGASAHTEARGAWTRVAPRASSFSHVEASERVELHYLAQPKGGSFLVEVAGKEVTEVATAAQRRAYTTIDLSAASVAPRGPFPLELVTKGDGEVRLFGAVFERDAPGVVVDSLGVGGTRAANMLAWNDERWATAIEARAPTLAILAYGANEAVDEDEPLEIYASQLALVLRRLRTALPNASCVLVGPVDFRLEDESGAWIERARISGIIEIQRELAFRHGCGFWDHRALQGGSGGMNRWVEQAPPLAKADHLHPTGLGYLYTGRTFTDALMARYDLASAAD